ncbi:MAG: ATP-binding protein [Pseudobdellovibrionaceae bacterium]|nr:ATP-binding protein [Pseudobdellovibrionaceae bacterium]
MPITARPYLFFLFLMLATSAGFFDPCLGKDLPLDETHLQKILPKGFLQATFDRQIELLKKLEQEHKDPVLQYLIIRETIFTQYLNDIDSDAYQNCQRLTIKSEDFRLRFICTSLMETAGIGRPQQIEKFKEIYHEAIRLQNTTAAIQGLSYIGWRQSEEGNVSDALSTYHEALSLVPLSDGDLKISIYIEIATLYFTHGDREYILKGVQILKDQLDFLKSLKNSAPEKDQLKTNFRIEIVLTNLSSAYLFHLNDQDSALQVQDEIIQISSQKSRLMQAYTFKALILALRKESQASLEMLNKAYEINPSPAPLLECYHSLIRKYNGLKANMDSCSRLPENIPFEHAKDLTNRFMNTDRSSTENFFLRRFFTKFLNKIEPELRKKGAEIASKTEVARLEAEAKIKDEKLRSAEKIKKLFIAISIASAILLILLLLVFKAHHTIKKKNKEIKVTTSNLQQVLDQIEEGIIKIETDGNIATLASSYAVKLFGEKFYGEPFDVLLQKLGLDGDQLAMATEVIANSLGEDVISWEINGSKLPSEIQIQSKPFILFWKAIEFEGLVNSLLLSIRDASTLRELQVKETEQKALHAVIQSGAKGSAFINHLAEYLDTLSDHADDKTRILRKIHTFKGEARSFGFFEIQDAIHRLEAALQSSRIDPALPELRELIDAVSSVQRIVKQIFSGVQLSNSDDIHSDISSVLKETQQRLLAKGLELESHVHVAWLKFTDKERHSIKEIFLHGVTNAIDHGFLRPIEKGQTLDPLVSLTIRVDRRQDKNFVEIIDSGAGIDWTALESMASQRNWHAHPGRPLSDLLFKDGVSTVAATELSSTSGRGVGLAALAAASQELGGDIILVDSPAGRGACLRISWPAR